MRQLTIHDRLSRGCGKRDKQTDKTQTFSITVDMWHAIPTKLGVLIKEACTISAPLKFFGYSQQFTH